MSVDYLDAPSNLSDMAGRLLKQNRSKYEKTIYYRTPATTPNGRKHAQAGWITLGGNNDNTMVAMLRRGFEPLNQFGVIPTDNPYGRWGWILRQPNGPQQFPVDQIKAFGWYRPERVPIQGVVFPQLAGEKITEYLCPECEHRRFLKANHLARHLKVSHDYDRTELIALSKEMGVNFSNDLTGGKIETTFEFGSASRPAEPVAPPPFEVQTERVPRREALATAAPSDTQCPDCGGTKMQTSQRCRKCQIEKARREGVGGNKRKTAAA